MPDGYLATEIRQDSVLVGAVRTGERAFYFWIYPNVMINWYENTLDLNLVLPLGIDRTEVIFDFYFTDISERARKQNSASIAVSELIQEEDLAICHSAHGFLAIRHACGIEHGEEKLQWVPSV